MNCVTTETTTTKDAVQRGSTSGLTWSFCVLPGEAASVVRAREFVAETLGGDQIVHDAVLAVSELVTNAIRHSWSALSGGKVVILVIRSGQGVSVAVVDQGSGARLVVPDASVPERLPECGMGLRVVDDLASGWGFDDLPVGHTVWTAFTKQAPAEDPRALITEILTLAGIDLRPAYRSGAWFRAAPWRLELVIDDLREGAHVAGSLPQTGGPGAEMAEFFDDPDVATRVFLDLVGELASRLAEEI